MPYVNQLYRAGWSIPRRNTFGYLKADVALSDVLTLSTGASTTTGSGAAATGCRRTW